MADPLLSDLIRGISPKKVKKSSDAVFDSVINEEVDRLMAMEDASNQLLPPEARRAKIEQEVRAEADTSEFQKSMSLADKIMKEEGANYLEKEEYNDLFIKLDELSQKVHDLDLKEVTGEKLEAALAMPVEQQTSILKIGIEKYKQGLIDESIAIFTYLTAIAANEPDYWYRFGLVLQKAQKFDLAIDAFNTVSDLSPDFVGSYLYKAECYLNQKMRDEARSELDKAKIILKTNNEQQYWQEHLLEIEDLFANIKE